MPIKYLAYMLFRPYWMGVFVFDTYLAIMYEEAIAVGSVLAHIYKSIRSV